MKRNEHLNSPLLYTNGRSLQPYFQLFYVSEEDASFDITRFCTKVVYEEQSYLVNQLIVTLRDGERIFEEFGVRAGGRLKLSMGDLSNDNPDLFGRKDNSFSAESKTDSFGEKSSSSRTPSTIPINYREKFFGFIKIIKTDPQADTGEFFLTITALLAPKPESNGIVRNYAYPDTSFSTRPLLRDFLQRVYGSSYSSIVYGPEMADVSESGGFDNDTWRIPFQTSPSTPTKPPTPAETDDAIFRFPLRSGNPRVTSPFGPRKVKVGSSVHRGVDFGTPVGTSVYPAAEGLLTLVKVDGKGINAGYGLYAVITHNINGVNYQTLYAHLDPTDPVNKNLLSDFNTAGVDSVRLFPDNPFARSGNSGTSSGPHLHFEIKEQNASGNFVAVNPNKYLSYSYNRDTDSSTSVVGLERRSSSVGLSDTIYITLREIVSIIASVNNYYYDDGTILVDDSIYYTLEQPAHQSNCSDHAFLTTLAFENNCVFWNEVYNDRVVCFFVDKDRLEDVSLRTPEGGVASKRGSYNFFFPRKNSVPAPFNNVSGGGERRYVYSGDIVDLKSREESGVRISGANFILRNLNISEDIGLLDRITPSASNLYTGRLASKETPVLATTEDDYREGLFITKQVLDAIEAGDVDASDINSLKVIARAAVDNGPVIRDIGSDKLFQIPKSYIRTNADTGEVLGLTIVSEVDLDIFVRGLRQRTSMNPRANRVTAPVPGINIATAGNKRTEVAPDTIFYKQAIPFEKQRKPFTFDWRGVRVTGVVDGNVNLVTQTWHNIFGITKYSSVINEANTRYFLRALTTTIDDSGTFETKLEFFQ